MTKRRVSVVKVGGSLYDWPRLPDALSRWLARQKPAAHVLLAGGGAMADLIRQADARFRLAPATAHWICVGLLTASARLIAALLPEARFISTVESLRGELQNETDSPIVFAVEHFLHHDEPTAPPRPLPHDWSVTSDSIAARLAQVLSADELVLLKSTNLPPGSTRSSAATGGLVDEYFPIASRDAPAIRWVNLRDPECREELLSDRHNRGVPGSSLGL